MNHRSYKNIIICGMEGVYIEFFRPFTSSKAQKVCCVLKSHHTTVWYMTILRRILKFFAMLAEKRRDFSNNVSQAINTYTQAYAF